MKKVVITLGFIVLFFSGCANKVYRQAHIKFSIQDATTQKPIKNAKIEKFSFAGKDVLTTDNDGNVEIEAKYATKVHMYPLPIPTMGSHDSVFFDIDVKPYNVYEFRCSYMSLSKDAECYPSELKKKTTQRAKDLLVKYKNEVLHPCQYHELQGKVEITATKLDPKHKDRLLEVTFFMSSPVDEKFSKFKEIKFGNDWGKEGLKFYSIPIRTQRKCDKKSYKCLEEDTQSAKIGEVYGALLKGDFGLCGYDKKSLELYIDFKKD